MPQIARNFPQKSGYTCFLLYKDVGNGQTGQREILLM